jgi:hypothetical protein
VVVEAFDLVEHVSLGFVACPLRAARSVFGEEKKLAIAALSIVPECQTLPAGLIEHMTP